VQTNGQVTGTPSTPAAPASTQTPQSQQQALTNQSQQQSQTQNQNCGFFCKLGNWLGGDGFKTDAEVTEDRRQWLLNHATNDSDKDKIRAASADKVNNTFECLQSASCAAKFQAYVQSLAQTVGLGGRVLSPAEQTEFDNFAQRAQSAGLQENPSRTGSWGKIDANGKFQEVVRIDVGEPGQPGMRGVTHMHIDGQSDHLPMTTSIPGEQ
jgi:hypothetical protein